MAQEVTCRFCKKKIEKSIALKVGTRTYYCDETCHRKQLDKNTYKPPKEKSNGEPNDRRLLTDWIMGYYISQGIDKHNINWKLITAQLKNMMEQKDDVDKDKTKLKYSGILLTLKYLVEIEGKNLLDNESGSVLGLVPSNYLKAKQHYLEVREIERAVDKFEFNDEVVVVRKSGNGDKSKMIDLEEL